jgi:hypothetical protein
MAGVLSEDNHVIRRECDMLSSEQVLRRSFASNHSADTPFSCTAAKVAYTSDVPDA